jgi:hypothetical protein
MLRETAMARALWRECGLALLQAGLVWPVRASEQALCAADLADIKGSDNSSGQQTPCC